MTDDRFKAIGMGDIRMPGGWSVLPGMRGKQPGGPQFVGVTQLLGLSTRQRHQPGFRLGRDDGITSCTRPIIKRLDHPQFRRSLQTTCHGLLRHPNRARHGVGRRVLQVGQNDPRPFDPARRLDPRPRNRQQTLPLLRIRRQRNHPARCYHWIPQSNPRSASYHISSRMRSQGPTYWYIEILILVQTAKR